MHVHSVIISCQVEPMALASLLGISGALHAERFTQTLNLKSIKHIARLRDDPQTHPLHS